jgi:hypothetical protein
MKVVSVNSLLPQLQGPQQGPQVAGQQQDETVAQQDVTSHETVVAEAVTKSRNKRDTANVALRATTRRNPRRCAEECEAQLHEEMRCSDHFAEEQTHSMCKGALDTESDDDEDEDLVSCIAGWTKLEPTVQPAASLPRDATPQPLEPASSAASSAVGDDEAESSAAASGDAASTPTPAASGGHAKSHTKGKRAPKKGMRPLKRGAPSTAPVQDGSPKRPNTPEFAASRPPTPLGTGAHAYAYAAAACGYADAPPTFETTRLSRWRIASLDTNKVQASMLTAGLLMCRCLCGKCVRGMRALPNMFSSTRYEEMYFYVLVCDVKHSTLAARRGQGAGWGRASLSVRALFVLGLASWERKNTKKKRGASSLEKRGSALYSTCAMIDAHAVHATTPTVRCPICGLALTPTLAACGRPAPALSLVVVRGTAESSSPHHKARACLSIRAHHLRRAASRSRFACSTCACWKRRLRPGLTAAPQAPTGP